jgi:hypothetical protein
VLIVNQIPESFEVRAPRVVAIIPACTSRYARHYPTTRSARKSPMAPVVSMFRMPIGIQPGQQSSNAAVR